MRKCALIVLYAVISTLPLLAQSGADTVSRNNPFKIDDRLYEIYRRADKNRSSHLCLEICDTLRSESIRLGDKKAECLSYVQPLFYWSRHVNFDSLAVAADKVREISRRHGYLQYYYQAYSQQSVAYLNNKRIDDARKVIDAMHADAVKDQYPFGLYNCYIQNAHIYNLQGAFSKAVSEYVKAAEYMEANIPDQSPSNAYLQASLSCVWGNDFENAVKFSRKGLEYYTESKTAINLYNSQCISLFILGREAEFREAYKKYQEAVEKYGQNSQKVIDAAVAANYAVNGQYDKALESISRDDDSFLKHRFMKIIYEKTGDWHNAVIQADSILQNAFRYYERTVELNAAEMTALFDNERLEADNTRLELENKLANRRTVIYLVFCVLLIGGAAAAYIILRNRKHIHQLKRANAAKDVFVKNMSHEVRTPLNAVVGFSQLLSEPEVLEEDERLEFAKAVADNGELLAMMIDDLLTTNDMMEGNYVIEKAPAYVKDICQSAVITSQTRLQQGVEMKYTDNLPENFQIVTDARRLQQILVNLLNNACKNTVEGTIVLESSMEQGRLILSVTDTGCGVPVDKAEKIFERFYKIDEFKSGSGLGLAICRDIVDRLDGKVFLDITHSPGARFIVTLPIENK